MIYDDLYYKAFDLVDELNAFGLKIAFAESLTGGLISSKLVDVCGASDVLLGGVVSYTNDIKINILGVKKETIDTYTEVSEQCAVEMAEGIRRLTGADIAFSATGYAGDYSDHLDGINDDDNMIGTVWFGFSTEDGTEAFCQFFPGQRDAVRLQAVEFVYDTILSYLRENYE